MWEWSSSRKLSEEVEVVCVGRVGGGVVVVGGERGVWGGSAD